MYGCKSVDWWACYPAACLGKLNTDHDRGVMLSQKLEREVVMLKIYIEGDLA